MSSLPNDPPADSNPPAGGANAAKPILEIIACDGADTSPVAVAAHGLGAEVRVSGSPEAWFERAANGGPNGASEPIDVAILVGGGERMAGQRWVARAVAAAPDTRIVAALVDATLDHVTGVVGQGARGLLALPNGEDRIAFHLREVVEAAVRRQPQRRAAAKHREGLASLTGGEEEVLDGMLEGLANKQIAQRLSIGLRTVELRRSKIMKKMGASNLAQLISFVCSAREDRR